MTETLQHAWDIFMSQRQSFPYSYTYMRMVYVWTLNALNWWVWQTIGRPNTLDHLQPLHLALPRMNSNASMCHQIDFKIVIGGTKNRFSKVTKLSNQNSTKYHSNWSFIEFQFYHFHYIVCVAIHITVCSVNKEKTE